MVLEPKKTKGKPRKNDRETKGNPGKPDKNDRETKRNPGENREGENQGKSQYVITLGFSPELWTLHYIADFWAVFRWCDPEMAFASHRSAAGHEIISTSPGWNPANITCSPTLKFPFLLPLQIKYSEILWPKVLFCRIQKQCAVSSSGSV